MAGATAHGKHRAASAAWWARALLELYGIEANLAPLGGEHDLNFAVEQSGIKTHVFKVMRAECESSFIEMQCAALDYIHRRAPGLAVPHVIRTLKGMLFAAAEDESQDSRLVWLITALPGHLYADVRPKPPALLCSLGRTLAELDRALEGFTHSALDRDLKWDLSRSDWIKPLIGLIDGSDRQELVARIAQRFEKDAQRRLGALPATPIHNDANDYNILVDQDSEGSRVSGILDFGDMMSAPAIVELAIAGAYAVLGQERPIAALAELVAGYHQVRQLTDEELSLVYPLLLTRLAVSVTNSAMVKREKPEDPYVTISERPAWAFLEASRSFAEEWVLSSLRIACGHTGHPASGRVLGWLSGRRGQFAPIVGRSLTQAPLLDLGIDGIAAPADPFELDPHILGAAIEAATDGAAVSLGRYAEPRPIYTSAEFKTGNHPASDRRTVHIGVDLFVDAGTEIRAPLDGMVHAVDVRPGPLDYGGVAVLEHRTPSDDLFYTLYGHLAAEVVDRLNVGQCLAAGDVIGSAGEPNENGGWPPHVHFQLGLTTLGRKSDWPGVVDPDELSSWTALFPNPAALLNLDDRSAMASPLRTETLLTHRSQRFGSNVRLSYAKPLTLLRGWKQFLFDQDGRTYLDAYNNVPHVGHCHPRVAAAAERQIRLLNTNTRYLHPLQIDYAEALTATLPGELSVCFFVNSGSEANELALRLARTHTGAIDTIVMDAAYHGNTNTAIDVSPYKFNGPGGSGARDWVEVVPLADPYRGKHANDPKAGLRYARHVAEAVSRIHGRGRKVAAFLSEVFPSVGGQVIPPAGYYRHAYGAVRKAGGLCIADEVQTGLGRIGTHFWAFETQGVVPDIVVLGKPMGNGHPMGAVITTPAIAGSFANGMEFFSTFGGSTVSCAIGREVLGVVAEEQLQANALDVGGFLMSEMEKLAKEHELIGEVRGSGLFIGIELVRDRASRAPATREASYVANRLREHRILIGTDGPFESALKIRPPLCFSRADATLLVERLAEVLTEEPCRL